jgi:hypothetical protein
VLAQESPKGERGGQSERDEPAADEAIFTLRETTEDVKLHQCSLPRVGLTLLESSAKVGHPLQLRHVGRWPRS